MGRGGFGVGSTPLAGVLLNGWSKLRNGIEVTKLFKDMEEIGFRPSKGTLSFISRAFSKPRMTWEARRLRKTLFKD